jgi:phenylacetate-CoA ligase
MRGLNWGYYYERFQREDQMGIHPDTSKKLLSRILAHCQQSVPYYQEIIHNLEGSFEDDPFTYLQRLPILTKDIIRSHFNELKSTDINQRKWRFATTGGSTGESLRFIADSEHSARAFAVTSLISKSIGAEVGESEILLWGSPREIMHGTHGWKAALQTKLSNSQILDASQLTSERMKEYIAIFNAKRPKLIMAYADALYELARFAEREKLEVYPQNAVVTSAGMLYPYMRQEIEKVFHCQVFNRYGSTEFGTIACERPGCEGLWVPPWTIYLEIVDNHSNPVPNGTEGNILVTSLSNYAMPLIRYRVGDRGVLSSITTSKGSTSGQILQDILGRDNDIFVTREGAIIHASYFAILLYFRDWIKRYQVIQKSYCKVIFRIVKTGSECPQIELNELTKRTKEVMGEDCVVHFDFVDEIPASNSGKFRYIISEVADPGKKDA